MPSRWAREAVRERLTVVVLVLALALLGVIGLLLTSDSTSVPPFGPDGVGKSDGVPVPAEAAAADAAIAKRVARADPSTRQFFTRGGAVVVNAYPTSIDRSGPATQGVALRMAFPSAYAFSGAFPESELAKVGARPLVGTLRLKATNVSRILVAVDLRTQKVVGVSLDATDGGARREVLSSSIPRGAIDGGD